MTDLRIGVEVGGTFTDWVVCEDGAVLAQGKVPSTPEAPERGALAALEASGADLTRATEVVHGSTVATNAVIERKGARTVLVATAGFGDVLAIQRQAKQRLFDLGYRHPEPLVDREHVIDALERVDASGAVVRELEAAATLESLSDMLEREPVTSVAICLLNSYVNPVHEELLREEIARGYPQLSISLSSEVSPQIREYERMSTTVMNAYVRPLIDRYVAELKDGLEARGATADLSIVQSNGGSLPAEQARVGSARMILSGPAGGVVGAIHSAERSGIRNIITMDMGGTSCDASIVHEGLPRLTVDYKIDGLPLQLPMLDIRTVGAGGGSIATIDNGGLLRVGPESAGSNPGPAAYGRSDLLTVTDVNLLLGFIRPSKFLVPDGRPADLTRARCALETLAQHLGLSAEDAGLGVRRLTNAMLARAVRLVSVEQGYDPSEYALIAYGGAGPLHAAEVAEELGIGTVLIPPSPGTLSAYGLLVGDRRHDLRVSRVTGVGEMDSENVASISEELQVMARREIADLESDPTWEITYGVDARYLGQAFQLTVDFTDVVRGQGDPSLLAERFHDAHFERYGHCDRDGAVELVTFGLTAVRRRAVNVTPSSVASTDHVGESSEGMGPQGATYLGREHIPSEVSLKGPLLIEEPTTNTYVPPLWEVRESFGNLLMTKV